MHTFKYLNKTISKDFIIFKQFYLFGKPLIKNNKLKDVIDSLSGVNLTFIEKKRFLGFGFVGISVNSQLLEGEIFHIEGEFNMVEFVGSYKQLDDFLKKVKKENPLGRGWINMYLNEPDENNNKIIAWVMFKNIV